MVKIPKSDEPTPKGLAGILMQAGKKQFGAETVSLKGLSEIVDFVDTRCYPLNVAIGRPGVPVGRLTVIQAKESVGKTTLALQVLAEVQSRGGIAVYLECESAFEADRAAQLGLYNIDYVEKLGLDVEPVVILKPNHILEAFTMIEFYAKKVRELDKDKLLFFVWDSVAATPSTAEADDKNEDYGSIQPGLAARQVSGGFRRLTSILNTTHAGLICTNFVKEKINSGGFGGWGDNTATIAQKPLGQHASVRIELVRMGDAGGKGENSTGVKVLAKLAKNKIAPPKRQAEFDLYYVSGTDNDSSMLEMAKKRGIVSTAGAYIKYNDQNFRAKDFATFEGYKDIVTELKRQVEHEQTSALGSWKPSAEEEEEEDYVTSDED